MISGEGMKNVTVSHAVGQFALRAPVTITAQGRPMFHSQQPGILGQSIAPVIIGSCCLWWNYLYRSCAKNRYPGTLISHCRVHRLLLSLPSHELESHRNAERESIW